MESKVTTKEGEGDKAQQAKKNMFLDLASGKTKQSRVQSLLASPDLNLLKLASPDLEKLLMAQTGLTPTPTQFICPKFVTDEQEAYARGFVEALAQLHGGSPIQAPFGMLPGSAQTPGTSNQADEDTSASTYCTMNPINSTSIAMSLPFAQFASSSAANTLASMGNMTYMQRRQQHSYVPSGLTLPATPIKNEDPLNGSMSTLSNFKEEPSNSSADQSVPTQSISPAPTRTSMGSDSPAPSQGSANNYEMDFGDLPEGAPEKLKLERKRARNRIAARKCRTRKLEKISRLEEKVSDLKSKNNELIQTATSLNEQVNLLKQQIMDHMKTGCQVIVPGVNLNTNNTHVLTNSLPPASG